MSRGRSPSGSIRDFRKLAYYLGGDPSGYSKSGLAFVSLPHSLRSGVQALAHHASCLLLEAMESELKSFETFKVHRWVSYGSKVHKNVVRSRWAFTWKHKEAGVTAIAKARLVATGFQGAGRKETLLPMRILLEGELRSGGFQFQVSRRTFHFCAPGHLFCTLSFRQTSIFPGSSLPPPPPETHP